MTRSVRLLFLLASSCPSCTRLLALGITMSPGGHYQTNNVASRFAAAQRGHAPQPQAAADNSYDDFLAGERAHGRRRTSIASRALATTADGGTGPCVCSWAGMAALAARAPMTARAALSNAAGAIAHGPITARTAMRKTLMVVLRREMLPGGRCGGGGRRSLARRHGNGRDSLQSGAISGVLGKTMTATAKTKAKSGAAFGPISGTLGSRAGWAMENGRGSIEGSGTFRVSGNARAYLVQDHAHSGGWDGHRYVRFDLSTSPLRFTLDLSNVPCGCLACVYLVAAADPSNGKSQYCDMAENVAPGAL